jgi:nucleoside-diphosphate-sugar epimerase
MICLVGGTGFVGSHLVKLLEADSRFNVKVFSRKPLGRFPYPMRGQIIQGDLLNEDALSRFLEPAAVVINLAYMPDRRPEENLRAIRNLADACAARGVSRLIHVSTAVVAGRAADDVITERTTCEPVTEYEKTRFEIEQDLLDRLGSCCVVSILRPTEVFGENGRGLVRLADQLLHGSGLINHLRRSVNAHRRSHLVYVDNVVAAIRYVISTDHDVHRQCYIVSDDDAAENNYQDVIRLLTKYLDVGPTQGMSFECPPSVLSAMLRLAGRSDTNPSRQYSCQKLLQLGFRKPVAFQEGLKCFADWYKRTRMDVLSA